MQLFIRPNRVFRALLVLVLALYILGLSVSLVGNLTSHGRLMGLAALFHLSVEHNIPTWFSSGLLLMSSALLAVIANAERSRQSRYVRYWWLTALMFLIMSVDEAASLHERAATAIGYVLPGEMLTIYGWVIPGSILVITIAAAYAKFLSSLPRETRRLFVISGLLYIGGAVVLEAVGRGWEARQGLENVPYTIMMTSEELMEMLGAALFVYALLAYIADHISDLTISIDHPRAETSEIDTSSS